MATPNIKLHPAFEPPQEIALEGFLLEALHPKHNDSDYAAWTSSVENILPILDPLDKWMADVGSKEQNLEDLTKDFQEFLDKKTFRYAILSPDRTLYLGCFYIRPTKATGFDCLVEYWFTDDSKHLEEQFHKVATRWLEDTWKFDAVAMPGREMTWKEYHSLEVN